MSLSRTLDQVLNTSFSTHESAFPLLDVQSTFQTVTEKHCLMDFLPQSLKCFISKQVFWRRKWQPTPVFLLGESHGQRSLVGYSPQGHKESDTTERLHFHFQMVKNSPAMWENWVQSLGWEDSLEEGNGDPLQYSCQRIPRTEEPGRLQAMGSQRVVHD